MRSTIVASFFLLGIVANAVQVKDGYVSSDNQGDEDQGKDDDWSKGQKTNVTKTPDPLGNPELTKKVNKLAAALPKQVKDVPIIGKIVPKMIGDINIRDPAKQLIETGVKFVLDSTDASNKQAVTAALSTVLDVSTYIVTVTNFNQAGADEDDTKSADEQVETALAEESTPPEASPSTDKVATDTEKNGHKLTLEEQSAKDRIDQAIAVANVGKVAFDTLFSPTSEEREAEEQAVEEATA